jgi:UDP-N-acetyl-D-mannosaminuronic acid transferase (WecB/TagA/CpsF family)
VIACAPEVQRNSTENSTAAAANRSDSSVAARNRNSRTILGIKFFAGRARDAVALGLKGGLVVAPAAPALVNLPKDEHYRFAVSSADVAITDSSLMVILWNLTRRDNIPRVSGLEYLTVLLQTFRDSNDQHPFFVMPSREAAVRTLTWLKGHGIQCADSHCYVAPFYATGEVEDPKLLALLEELRPTQIIIGLGGGTQEKLGLFLRRRLSYAPGIHCIGAAIGFLTGDQVRIPMWADRFYFGWLFRCLYKPTSYIPRYWRARKLFWQLIFGEKGNAKD